VGRDLEAEVLFSRAGVATQILVRAAETRVLFDVGDGSVRDLLRKGVSPELLSGAFLTHGHMDHLAGLYGVLGYLRAEDSRRKFRVWYPQGCSEAEATLHFFHSCYDDSLPYPLDGMALKDGDVVNLEEITVLARATDHWNSVGGHVLSATPTLGYRLSFRGQTIAITGDTASCPVLQELVWDVDLALIDATLEEANGNQRAHLHLTVEEATRLGRLAKRAVLIHRPDGQLFPVVMPRE